MINNPVLITGRSNRVVIDEWSTEWTEGEIRSDTAQRQIQMYPVQLSIALEIALFKQRCVESFLENIFANTYEHKATMELEC